MSNILKRVGQRLMPPDAGEPVTWGNIIKAVVWMPLIPAAAAGILVFGGVEAISHEAAPDPAAAAPAPPIPPAAPAVGNLGHGVELTAAESYMRDVRTGVDAAKTPEAIDKAYWGVACRAYSDLFGDTVVVPDFNTSEGRIFLDFMNEAGPYYGEALAANMGWKESGAHMIEKVVSVSSGETTYCP